MEGVLPHERAARDGRSHLLAGLSRLDSLLAGAVARAETVHGGDGANDRFRGLHVELAEVARLLLREPGAPLLSAPDAEPGLIASLAGLEQAFGLRGFDLDVLLIALAPELDLRYERLYAYLQDDVSRRRATVSLALDLLCRDSEEKLARRDHFAADAPLLRHGLLELVADPGSSASPLLARELRADDQVIRVLTDAGGLDSRLAAFARLLRPTTAFDDLALPPSHRRALTGLAAGGVSIRLYLEGPRGSGRARAAEAFAAAAGRPLVTADVGHADARSAATIRLLFREVALRGAVLSVTGLDALRAEPDAAAAAGHLLAEVARAPGTVIMHGSRPWAPVGAAAGEAPLGVHIVAFDLPDVATRRRLWQDALDRRGIRVAQAPLDDLASRFRLTPAQIGEAVAQASAGAIWRTSGRAGARNGPNPAGAEDLLAAARSQTGHELRDLAVKVEPAFAWADIVLPDDSVRQLRELCLRVVHHEQVMTGWRLGLAGSRGRGVAALFAGPPGTGKTMAAEIVARELGLDMYRIDLAGVVSKWIGETEKNLGRIFDAAENANAILLFDEAEALFGKRSEVREAHDRYANVEIAYLLQRLEAHDGVSILTTNQADNLDEAFTRRLAHVIRFPLPQAAERKLIWGRAWSPEVPLSPDLELADLAAEVPLTGAEIRNAAVTAAFLAAEDGSAVTLAQVRHAVRREYEKQGRTLEPFAGHA